MAVHNEEASSPGSPDQPSTRTESSCSHASSSSDEADKECSRATKRHAISSKVLRSRSLPQTQSRHSTAGEPWSGGVSDKQEGRKPVIGAAHLVSRRLSGKAGSAIVPFKMPIPNYRPSQNKPVAQLGLRKPYQASLSSLLNSITKHIATPTDDSNQEQLGQPFMVYNPDNDEDEGRKTSLKAVYVEPLLAGKLRPHQREGVSFMFNCMAGLRKGGYTGCILMDGMGLGKTFQSICTLWTLLTTGTSGQPTCSRPLILCPSSLVMNWGNELKRWLGSDRVDPLVLDDTRGAVVKDVLTTAWGGARGALAALAASRAAAQPQVLVMSYTTFRMHKEAVYKKGIDVVICDEAHCLKNGDSQITQAVSGIPAARRLLLSGTPVQNDLSEFYTLFHVAVPGLLGEAGQFRKTYELPILRGQDADASEREVSLGADRSAQLLAVCGAYMLRRTCGVMAQYLPQKIEQVVFCRMSPLQIKLYNHFYNSQPVQRLLRGGRAAELKEQQAIQAAAAAAAAGQDKASGRKGKTSGEASTGVCTDVLTDITNEPDSSCVQAASTSRTSNSGVGRASGAAAGARSSGKGTKDSCRSTTELSVLAAITAVKKLCCHPDLIHDMFAPSKPGSFMLNTTRQNSGCMTASGRVSGGNTTTTQVASAAVITGFEDSLPLFHDSQTYPAYQPGRCDPYHSGKVMVLVQLLKSIRKHEPTDKVVLVSNYTEALDILAKLCAEQQWPCLRLDGSLSVKARQPLVDSFNDPAHPSFLLLLSSKAGGVGLNIIGANRLVLFDPDWNPANDLQAMARVWREGQKKRVWIYRLLTTGSLEEKVYQRQLMKQGLSKTVVDDGGNQHRQFSTEELRGLFKVDPSVMCDTHSAIKCKCDGQPSTMASKAAEVAMQATEQAGSATESNKAPAEAGVAKWAHLQDIEHSPDEVWKHVPAFVRQKFVTYLFSDHITQASQETAKIESDVADEGSDHEMSDQSKER